MDNFSGISPLASPAGVAQTPDAPPVGSGHGGGFFGSSLVAVKYPGSFGAGAAAAGAAAGVSALGASAGVSAFFSSSAAIVHPVNITIHNSIAMDAINFFCRPLGIFPPPVSAVIVFKS